MRVLHTSDWHLGRSFGAFSLLDDQRRAVERMVAMVREHRVDLVVVAGDVFDRAVPSTEAVVLLRDALTELRGAGAQVVAIAGNHDGPERMAAYDGLLEPGLVVVGGYRRAGELTTLVFADGELDVAAIPFLDPLLAPPSTAALAADGDEQPARPTHASVLHERLRAARARLGERRSIAVAHAFVAGGTPSPSERELSVGGAEQIGVGAFRGFDYVALGHLHQPQAMGRPTLAYSGSPLAYSFAETAAKSVVLVDIPPPGGGAVEVERVELGVCRGVATLTGTLDELLTDPAHDAVAGCWVRAQLTDVGALVEPMARLRKRFPFTVELHRRAVAGVVRGGTGGAAVDRSPLATVVSFWRATTEAEPDAEVLGCIRGAFVAAGVHVGEAPVALVDQGSQLADGSGDEHDGVLPGTLFDESPYVAPDKAARSRRLRAVS